MGQPLGPVPNLAVRRIFWKQLSVLGSTMGSPSDFMEMLTLFGGDKLRPVIDQTFPLREAGQALRRMEQGAQFGKIVLTIP